MSGYEPSRRARSAVETLLHAIEQEPVPDTHVFNEDRVGLPYQRALAVLRACAAADRGEYSRPVEQQAATASNEPAKNEGPELVVSRFGGGPQAVKTVDLSKLHGYFPQEEPSPLAPQLPAPEPQHSAAAAAGDASPVGTPIEGQSELPSPPAQKDIEPAALVRPVEPAPPSLLTVKEKVRLKNARAGEPYSELLALTGARDVKLVNASRTGLEFDEVALTFSGQPEEAGDFEIKLKGRIGDRPADITAALTVNPDPRKMWDSFPSDSNDPYWKPDECFTLVQGSDLRLVAASKRGRSHARDAGFREDDFAFATHGDWQIAAVADGAGSAKYSREGSKLAVETVTAQLPALIDQHLGEDFHGVLMRHFTGEDVESEIGTRLYHTLVTAAFNAADALVSQAEAMNESVSKLSTTLILVLARRFDTRWFVAGFSIGDGGAAVFDLTAKTVQPLTAPDSGEYAGQTRFLTKAEFAEDAGVTKRLRFATPERFTTIALMSDGITDPKLPTDKAFADPAVWESLWADDLTKEVDFSAPEPEIEKQFLAWLDFWSPGNHDDRTLAVLLPREG